VKAITSRENPVFKSMARLVASSSERKRQGLSLIEGANLLDAFIETGGKPQEILATKAALEDPGIARLVGRSGPARVTVLSEALFDALSGVQAPSGILACVRTPAPRKVPPTAPLVLMLENIQDPGNVGTLLRSAAAAGAGHVLLSRHCAFAWSPKVLRSAMGAHFALNIVEDADLEAFIGAYRGTSVALTVEGESSVYELDLRGPIAFIIGNEGAGLSESLKAHATRHAKIPMPGRMESLNAGVAGSLCLFEAVRQRAAAAP
jgi:TrmH family RNA methyltransferase